MMTKRSTRFSNYLQATQRRLKQHVNPDGTPLTPTQIAAKELFSKMKKITTR